MPATSKYKNNFNKVSDTAANLINNLVNDNLNVTTTTENHNFGEKKSQPFLPLSIVSHQVWSHQIWRTSSVLAQSWDYNVFSTIIYTTAVELYSYHCRGKKYFAREHQNSKWFWQSSVCLKLRGQNSTETRQNTDIRKETSCALIQKVNIQSRKNWLIGSQVLTVIT